MASLRHTAAGGRDVPAPDGKGGTPRRDGRFERPDEETSGAARVSKPSRSVRHDDRAELLNRVAQQAESLGTMRARLGELETAVSEANAEVRDLRQKLRTERQRHREQEAAVSELDYVIGELDDTSADLELERQFGQNLEVELARAWAQVHALMVELERTRRGALRSARRFFKRS